MTHNISKMLITSIYLGQTYVELHYELHVNRQTYKLALVVLFGDKLYCLGKSKGCVGCVEQNQTLTFPLLYLN